MHEDSTKKTPRKKIADTHCIHTHDNEVVKSRLQMDREENST